MATGARSTQHSSFAIVGVHPRMLAYRHRRVRREDVHASLAQLRSDPLARARRLAAHGQAYPAKPVRLIVPFPPGGAVDYYARAVQNRLADTLGQPIVIENRTGAGGMVGAELVAKSPPDGYTLLVGNIAALAINVGIYSKMPYDPVKDLTPIMRTVAVDYVMVVHPSVPAQDDRRAHRLREGESGQAQLRLRGQRERAASLDRALQGARRHRHGPRPVQGRRADGDRPSRRDRSRW